MTDADLTLAKETVGARVAIAVSGVLFAMAHGVALEQLLNADTPDDLFGTILRLFFAGLALDSQSPA